MDMCGAQLARPAMTIPLSLAMLRFPIFPGGTESVELQVGRADLRFTLRDFDPRSHTP